MANKKTTKTFDVWVRRDHTFTAKIEADTLEDALSIAKSMDIDDLIDAPGDTIESEHAFVAVMKS